MKAIVRDTYGPPEVLRLDEVQRPAPGAGEVLVRVHAASANAGDWHLLRGTPFPFRLVEGLLRPKHRIIGTDIAGRVEAVGPHVSQFQPGDEVFGELSRSGFGGYAEYVAVPEIRLATKPTDISFEEAAAVPTSGLTALQGLRKGKIWKGQKVLVHGAAGGVGTFAVQLAKAFGTEVTAVCGRRSVDVVRSVGADIVLDCMTDDFAQSDQVRFDPGRQWRSDDLGLQAWAESERCLRQCAAVPIGSCPHALFLGPLLSFGDQKFGNLLMRPNQPDLVLLKDLIERGKVRPVIERRYTLGDVPDAVRHIEEGHARGKLVIRVEPT